MAYQPYATLDYYMNTYQGGMEDTSEILKALVRASRHIDSLTYNRTLGIGYDNLTPFQQEILSEVVCQQADFEVENADAISSVLSSYSINGVSVSFGSSWNVYADKGIAMRRDTYALLCQTGLCCRQAR